TALITRRASAGGAPAPRRPAARTALITRRASAGGAPAPRRPAARTALFRQRVQRVHRDQEIARLAELAEPAAVDLHDLARPVEAREHPVHGQPERRVAAAEHEAVRLVGEVLLADRELP